MKKINFYKTEKGFSPVEKFLDSLDDKQVQKILWVLKLIQELDKIPIQYFKKLVNTDNIWEVRITISGNIFRILCFFEEKELIILTNSFQKKTQKTPRKEIKIAEQRKKDYLERKQKNG